MVTEDCENFVVSVSKWVLSCAMETNETEYDVTHQLPEYLQHEILTTYVRHYYEDIRFVAYIRSVDRALIIGVLGQDGEEAFRICELKYNFEKRKLGTELDNINAHECFFFRTLWLV